MRTDVYWIYIQSIIGYGSRKLLKILDKFNDAETFCKAPFEEKERCGIFSKQEIARLNKFNTENAYKTIDKCERLGYKIITPDNDEYPVRLRHLVNPPAVLYVKGTMPDVDNEVMIAVVGTRKASDYGRSLTFELSRRLTEAGAFIVSGGAIGIDTSAHTGALSAHGNTVAVLGCGLNYGYLAANEALREDIAENGCLITEYPPDYPSYGYNFPVRNRIISGLCLGTVVVEASRRSGSLITVDHALEQGRDIFVIPGDVSSDSYVGSNRLIRDGAKIVTAPIDILEEYTHLYPHKLNIAGCDEMLRGTDYDGELFIQSESSPSENKAITTKTKKKAIAQPKPTDKSESAASKGFKVSTAVTGLSDDAMSLYLSFENNIMLFDRLVELSGLTVGRALAAATELEISGVAESMPGGQYRIVDTDT